MLLLSIIILIKLCSFADDVKISLSYRNTTERNILQSGLNDLYDWTVKWNLQIAFEK